MLHELGGDAAASLAAANAHDNTPAHVAAATFWITIGIGCALVGSSAQQRQELSTTCQRARRLDGCLRVLHMALRDRLRKYLLTRVRGIAHVHILLARWSADARAAAYAPGGAGHALARASFETSRVALQQKT